MEKNLIKRVIDDFFDDSIEMVIMKILMIITLFLVAVSIYNNAVGNVSTSSNNSTRIDNTAFYLNMQTIWYLLGTMTR